MDLVLILDASSSVSYTNFKKQVRLALHISNSLDISPGGSHIGVIHVGDKAVVQVDLNKQGASRNTIEHQLAKMPYVFFVYQLSRQNLALKTASEMFSKTPLSRNVPKVLVVIADGPVTGSSATLVSPAKDLRDMGVSVFTVSVGYHENEKELDIMSSTKYHSVKAKSFSHLLQMSDELTMNVICPGKYLGTDHYFFIRGVTIFGTCRQFFSEE